MTTSTVVEQVDNVFVQTPGKSKVRRKKYTAKSLKMPPDGVKTRKVKIDGVINENWLQLDWLDDQYQRLVQYADTSDTTADNELSAVSLGAQSLSDAQSVFPDRGRHLIR